MAWIFVRTSVFSRSAASLDWVPIQPVAPERSRGAELQNKRHRGANQSVPVGNRSHQGHWSASAWNGGPAAGRPRLEPAQPGWKAFVTADQSTHELRKEIMAHTFGLPSSLRKHSVWTGARVSLMFSLFLSGITETI